MHVISCIQVFKIAYCDHYDPSMFSELNCVCKEFFDTNMLKKHKIHLILHLVECIEQLGPSSAFNSERCVTSCHCTSSNMCNVMYMYM